MKKISPSMMCADINRIEECIRIFHEENIEYLHIDVMDGIFVPNFCLGSSFVTQLRRLTEIPMDIHMMVMNPESKIEWFEPRSGDIVSVHVESTNHIQRCLRQIKASGAKAAVALNPATPLQTLDYILEDLDVVLLMTVNPGFAGQKVVPQAVGKIKDTKEYLTKKGFPDIEIEVDGNVSFALAPEMSEKHADIFVAGTSSVFSDMENIGSNIRKLRDIIGSV